MSGANMSGAIMSGANMSDANMSGANMSGANMSGADMCGADMSGADMCDAIMRSANMCDANIDNISMFDTTGNSVNIITQQLGKYTINYTHDRLQIGCKNYSIDKWFNFSDDEIELMDDGALVWWSYYKDFIKQSIQLTPASKP